MKKETRTFPSFTAHCPEQLNYRDFSSPEGLCVKNTCVCFDAPVGTSASYLHSSLKLSVYDFCHFNYFFIKLSSVNHSSAITQYEKGNLRNLTVLQLAFSDVCSSYLWGRSWLNTIHPLINIPCSEPASLNSFIKLYVLLSLLNCMHYWQPKQRSL